MEKLITHRYKESTVEHYCDFCQRHITTTNINEDLPSQYKGQNWGIGGKKEIRCQSCKKQHERAYDNYVDPLNARH